MIKVRIPKWLYDIRMFLNAYMSVLDVDLGCSFYEYVVVYE